MEQVVQRKLPYFSAMSIYSFFSTSAGLEDADLYAGIYTARMLMIKENTIENRQIKGRSIGLSIKFILTPCANSQKHGIVMRFAIAVSLIYSFISLDISLFMSEPNTFLMAVCFLCSVVKYIHIPNKPMVTRMMAMIENDPIE